jgi:hypothetical protein
MVIYRWTINLALKTAEKMFYADTPFTFQNDKFKKKMKLINYFLKINKQKNKKP